jgi:hypothetical protein
VQQHGYHAQKLLQNLFSPTKLALTSACLASSSILGDLTLLSSSERPIHEPKSLKTHTCTIILVFSSFSLASKQQGNDDHT